MKNQYFADERDYGKYDLLLEILQKIGVLERLTIIPMLTTDDESGEGRRTTYEQGCRRSDLHRFLKHCLNSIDRNITHLREYFKKHAFAYDSYRDTEPFTHERRNEYFRGIQGNTLNQALVFFDPDIGLEPDNKSSMKKTGPDKYLLWSELVNVWSRTSKESVGVVYQHLQRNVAHAYGDMLCKGKMLCDKLSIPSLICVDQVEVAFYVFANNQTVRSLLLRLMPYYAGMAGLRFQVIPGTNSETRA